MNLSKIVRGIAVTTVSLALIVGCGNSGGSGGGHPHAPFDPSDPTNPGGNLGGFVNPAPIELLTSGNYVILAKTGISSVPASVLTGDIAVSPASLTAITGFGPTQHGSYAEAPQVTGNIYAADLASPTPNILTTAVGAMETAYTNGSGRTNPDRVELLAGDISGVSFGRGLYKWTGNVVINDNVYIYGSSNDVFIFQIAGQLTMAAGKKIFLQNGAQAKNVFFVVADAVEIGTGAHFEGIILGQTNAALLTSATMNGRLLMQSAVTLDQATVTQPL